MVICGQGALVNCSTLLYHNDLLILIAQGTLDLGLVMRFLVRFRRVGRTTNSLGFDSRSLNSRQRVVGLGAITRKLKYHPDAFSSMVSVQIFFIRLSHAFANHVYLKETHFCQTSLE